jgi:hypothetical protein
MFVELFARLKEGPQKLVSRLSDIWSEMFARIQIYSAKYMVPEPYSARKDPKRQNQSKFRRSKTIKL